jgi:hypothetical protein
MLTPAMSIASRPQERRLDEADAQPVCHVPRGPATRKWQRARVPSAALGAAASAAMLAFYAAVVVGASRSVPHLVDQVGSDWYLILPIAAGFGVQVGLLVELRRRRRLHREAAAAGVAGAGSAALTGDPPGGHHRSGELRFAAQGEAAGPVTLSIGGFSEPVDVWWPSASGDATP